MYSWRISTFEIMAGVSTPWSDVLPVSNTARKTIKHIFFFQTSWKDGISKKIALEYDLSCIIGKDHVSFSQKYDLTSETENERWSLSKKAHENTEFSSNFLKRWSFQKGRRRDMIFLVLSGKMVFFPKTRYFFLGQEARDGPSQEIHGNMIFSVHTCGCYKRGVTPLSQKKSRMVLSHKLIDILERAPAIPCTFKETCAGVFMY